MQRREFLQHSKRAALGFGAALTILPQAASVHGAVANEKLNLAIVGMGGRGPHLAHGFLDRDDCEISYASDCDATKLAKADKFVERQDGREVKRLQDFRRVLDDKSVDAVVIATPDHWHAPATVFACQAGKHVYVEKPASHSAWEGRKMVEAARKYNRVVQLGTQNRSAPYNFAARDYIASGKLGDIHMCRVYDQKNWGNRPVVADAPVPEGLDWNIWLGAAPMRPYNESRHHGWHHFWDYSGGDIANDSSHQIDLARWLCGVDYPKTVYSTGGRYASEGAYETPDTQLASYEFDDMLMSFEMTLYTPYMLKNDAYLRDHDLLPHWPQNATRIELFGTEGFMVVGRHGGGWQVFDRPKSREPVVKEQMYGRFPDPEHKEDFVQSIREGRRPNADIEQGHLSALLIHYANISYRLGEKVTIDPKTEGIVGNDEAMALFRREYREPFVIPDNV